VIAFIALFAALGGGYAIGANKVDTEDIRKQAVTNKKIKKKTIKASRVKDDTLKGGQINESTLGTVPTADVAGTGRSTSNDGPIVVGGGSGFTTAATVNVPAGSYLFIGKTNLAKGPLTLLACRTVAEGDSDTATTHVASDQNVAVTSTVAHTFAAAGSATLECNNPTAGSLVLTQAKLSAIPFAALESNPAP
jgi:hypothetical protein